MTLFRYPGGKSRIVPPLLLYLHSSLRDAKAFHDVFVGGGSVSIGVAKEYPNLFIHMNDLDPCMSAFWEVMVGPEYYFIELLERLKITPTIELFQKLRELPNGDLVDRAFRAVFFNRTTFSGIATSGPIGGLKQESKYKVYCRYNSATLVKEAKEVRKLLVGRAETHSVDAPVYLKDIPDEHAIYLDPPYFLKGEQLYSERVDHTRLAQVLHNKKNWVLSYDSAPQIKKLYDWAIVDEISTRYSIKGHKRESWDTNVEFVIHPKQG